MVNLWGFGIRTALVVGLLAAPSAIVVGTGVAHAAVYTPSDPLLSATAKNVLNRFAQYKGQYIVAGQQEVTWGLTGRMNEMSNKVAAQTSPTQQPEIRGWDVPFGGETTNDAQWMINEIISNWQTAKVIPTMLQHWTPAGDHSYDAMKSTIVDITSLLNPASATAERASYLRWRTNVADDLLKLQAADVPVLFRPYHEAGGQWFWWDRQGTAKYVALWNDLYSYLTTTRGVHNLIWVWSAGKLNIDTNYYPGETKVDVIGQDTYGRSSADYSAEYNDLARYSTTKLRAMPEAEYLPAPSTAFATAPFAYVAPWVESWFDNNGATRVNSFYNDPRTVARGRSAAFLNGTLPTISTPPPPTPVRPTTLMYGFEGASSQGWSATGQNAGPWSVNEWANEGSYSLKADVGLGARETVLKLVADQSLVGKTRLTAAVRHASWGSMGSGMTAKLFVQTGSGWAWKDGGAMVISSGGATTLTLNLSSVPDLGQVRALGVSFVSPANSSGTSAVYVDNVRVA